ncbi:MAG: DUF1570 domain-containing protein [Planctomycetota bacterium]
MQETLELYVLFLTQPTQPHGEPELMTSNSNLPLIAFRSIALGALVFCLLLPSGCGDEASSTGVGNGDKAQASPITDGARERLDRASDNAKKLHETLVWIRGQAKGKKGLEGGSVGVMMHRTERNLTSSVTALVKKIGNADSLPNLKKLETWIAETIASEKSSGHEAITANLEKQLSRSREYMLAMDPNNDALRVSLGWHKVEVDFDDVGEAPYLDTTDFDELKKVKKLLKAAGEKSGHTIWLRPGWNGEARYNKFLASIEKKRVAYAKLMEDPWEQKAQKIAEEVGAFIRKDLENDSYKFVARTHRPYVLIVEKDSRWNETEVARKRGEALTQLHQIYYEKYASNVKLEKVKDPVPVIYFHNHDAYVRYTQKRGMGGASGHFEPSTGRLFTSKETDIGTVFHEGAHQLSFFSSGASVSFLERSYWFEEGLAEYLAANTISKDKENDRWVYEIGLLQKGRLNYWRTNPQKAYSVWDLIELTYAHREINTRNDDQDKNLMVYSQGWFLCYFMNNFNIDAKGMVVIGKHGKYRDAWIRFFESNLGGNSSREKFLECIGAKGQDDPKFILFDKEFNAYFEWMNRKLAMKQDKDKKLIPWADVINKGRHTGELIDDMLYPPE